MRTNLGTSKRRKLTRSDQPASTLDKYDLAVKRKEFETVNFH